MDIRNKWKQLVNNRDGYVSIEAVFAMSFFLIVFILVLGFFTYVYPYSNIQREVHALATLAERQGGLTADDIANFETSLEKYDFINNSTLDTEVIAITSPSGIDATNISSTNYVSRDSLEVINVTVKVPSNNLFIKPVAKFFGVTSLSDYYVFVEPVMSEKY